MPSYEPEIAPPMSARHVVNQRLDPRPPPPRNASRPVRPRRAADRTFDQQMRGRAAGVHQQQGFNSTINSQSMANSASLRSPSEPVPICGGQNASAHDGAKVRAASTMPQGSVEEKAAKAKAVTLLQKLFFEELSHGSDANDAAARALRRLTDQASDQTSAQTSLSIRPELNMSSEAFPAARDIQSTPQELVQALPHSHNSAPRCSRPWQELQHRVTVQN